MLKDSLEVEDGEAWYAWSMEQFLMEFRPGSKDDSWTWNDEFNDLIGRPETLDLIEDIKANGMKRPILLGDDNRVWDGHHRVVAAILLGYKQIPVTFAHRPRWASSF